MGEKIKDNGGWIHSTLTILWLSRSSILIILQFILQLKTLSGLAAIDRFSYQHNSSTLPCRCSHGRVLDIRKTLARLITIARGHRYKKSFDSYFKGNCIPWILGFGTLPCTFLFPFSFLLFTHKSALHCEKVPNTLFPLTWNSVTCALILTF